MSSPQVSEKQKPIENKNRNPTSREEEKALQEKTVAHNSLITGIQENLRHGQGSIAATEDVDGMTIYGLIATGGSIAKALGKALEDFKDTLESSNSSEEGKGEEKDRFENISERFNRLVQKTDDLSKRAEQVDLNRREERFRDSVAEITEALPELEEDQQKAVIGEELEGGLRLLSDHLDKIRRTAGLVEEPSSRIDFDITFPASQQLDQLEAILQELESRVDELDEKLTELESSNDVPVINQPEPKRQAEKIESSEQPRTSGSSSSITATKLADSFKATTIVKGTLLSDPLYTSIGRVDYKESDTREEIIVTDEADKGVIFRAQKEAGMPWQAEAGEDKLTEEERKRISHAPSTEEEVAAHNILTTLQKSYPEAFREGKEIRIGDDAQGFYTFQAVQQGDNRSVFGKDPEQVGFLHVQERAGEGTAIFHFSDPAAHSQRFDQAIAAEQQHRDNNAERSGVMPRAPASAYEL
ncbi:MAG: hypothetical protein AAF050_00620 [Cyanobacteria bacterium J06649_5]